MSNNQVINNIVDFIIEKGKHISERDGYLVPAWKLLGYLGMTEGEKIQAFIKSKKLRKESISFHIHQTLDVWSYQYRRTTPTYDSYIPGGLCFIEPVRSILRADSSIPLTHLFMGMWEVPLGLKKSVDTIRGTMKFTDAEIRAALTELTIDPDSDEIKGILS